MKRVSKRERQLYDLLEQASELLANPSAYGMREYYAMDGTEDRKKFMAALETVLQPYRELREKEQWDEYQYPD